MWYVMPFLVGDVLRCGGDAGAQVSKKITEVTFEDRVNKAPSTT